MQSPVKPLPVSSGIGLRGIHVSEVLQSRPNIPWLEVHSENFFIEGGPLLANLEAIAQHYPLSFHGVGLSLGSASGLDLNHLATLKKLVCHFSPALVSEHISWSRVGETVMNDLLPIPYTEESLAIVCDHVNQVQDCLRRTLLVENPSSYIAYNHSTLLEWEFMAEVSQKTGCGILLDVNNIYVSSQNHGFDALTYIHYLNPAMIHEIHLAGHHVELVEGYPLHIDTHSTHVCNDVWELYAQTLKHTGPKPTLIEWDSEIPSLSVLMDEAAKAQMILENL
ncbi:MAG: DUF692 domain-containing protein [Alphaproteobacteria bacterium]|nr:DUF692 domain-containing protein [Alphaproteobacteria bacterium]